MTHRPVTLVVLTWNGLAYTRECLDSLRAVTRHPDYRVVVVDNGSTDGTVEYLRSLDGIHLIESPKNVGFAKGNNLALDGLGTDAVLLNNDLVFTQPDWLEKLQETANAEPDVGLVVCRLVNSDGRLYHAGTFMPSTWRGQQIGGGQLDVGQYNQVREVEGGVAAVLYIRQDLLAKVGGLDPDYFSYFEDTDYCLKAREAGFRVMYDGRVTVVHHQNVSTKVNRASLPRMYAEGQRVFLSKWREKLESRYDATVAWRSWYFNPPGYANCSRAIATHLESAGVKVSLRYLDRNEDGMELPDHEPFADLLRRRPESAPAEVTFGWGDLFHLNEGPYKIGYTMLEVDGLPEDWVRQANLMDEVWVPSAFNVETFRESGVKRPIHRMPLGYDANFFNPGIRSFRADDRFTFLSIFEWGERKAPEILIRAFTEEFSAADDVQLIIKTSNRDPAVDVQQQVAELRIRPGRAPVVVDLNRPVPAYQMGAIYRSADAFVFPTRGEGWGYPVMEAMACSLPVISTAWSAVTEFFSAEVGYPVAHRLVPAVARCPYYTGFRWAEPELEDLRARMRYVYEHRDEARRVGLTASEFVQARYALPQTTATLAARLREVGAAVRV